MDPLTQGVLGASWAQSAATPARIKTAAVLGVAAGVTPDLDVLISSTSDPLLFLEFHRQFTHSLFFVPVGALAVAGALYRWSRKHLSFLQGYWFCLLGFASHGLLDACTSYGTQLFWPLSDLRVAFSIVSVVDPLFTLPVLGLLALALRRRRASWARAAALWAVVYLSVGWMQNQRAVAAAIELSENRGHIPSRLEAKPALGSVLLWKTIYDSDGRYYVDAVKAGVRTTVYTGESIAKLDLAEHFPWLDPLSQQARDVERFATVADGFLALDDRAANRIVDMRYSMLPNEIDAFWAIELDPQAGPDAHVRLLTTRERAPEQLRKLIEMLF